MTERKIRKVVQGVPAVDGAGVHLTRVLEHDTVEAYDPFLMLDSFDSTDPADYVKGFPLHAHRGIETITYLIEGSITHRDSLGNQGTIQSGQSQWMTAGSGIMHEEMPHAADRMLGFQLWLNLPQAEKMADPAYLEITQEMIPLVKEGASEIRILTGSYKETVGTTPRHLPATIYDVFVPKGESIELATERGQTVFVFLIEGDAIIEGKTLIEKSAVLFDEGDTVVVAAPKDADARFIFYSAPALREPVAWGGPIVMNSEDELEVASTELREGTFIKHEPLW